MIASDLEDLIVRLLVRQTGASRRQWQLAVGSIRVHDQFTHPHCNWSLAPSGTPRENELIEDLLDRVRLDHPIVTRG